MGYAQGVGNIRPMPASLRACVAEVVSRLLSGVRAVWVAVDNSQAQLLEVELL